MKKIIFVIFLTALTIFLYSCKKAETYRLTLPNEIIANVSDLEEIKENTNVTITVDVPDGMEIDWIKVNGVNVETISNTYSFPMVMDTVITISFKGISVPLEYFTLKLPDGVRSNVIDINNVVSNQLVTLTITIPVDKELNWLKVNGIEVPVTNNTYNFNIKGNTVVTVEFKDIVIAEEYFKLTLPETVVADATTLSSILKGTLVKLTINVPDTKELVSLSVNDVVVVTTNNTYEFNITKDTVIIIEYKDRDLELEDLLVLIELFKSGDFNIFKNEKQIEFILDFDDVNQGKVITSFKNDELLGTTLVITDGEPLMYYNNGVLYAGGSKEELILNKQSTELFLGSFLGGDFSFGLISLEQAFSLLKNSVGNYDFETNGRPRLSIVRNETNKILKVDFNKAELESIIKNGPIHDELYDLLEEVAFSNFDDLKLNIELKFNLENELIGFDLEVNLISENETGKIKFVAKENNESITVPKAFEDYISQSEIKAASLYLDDKLILDIPLMPNRSDEYNYYLLQAVESSVYIDGYIVEGLYLDKELTMKITNENYHLVNDKIYLKVYKEPSLSEFKNKLGNSYIFVSRSYLDIDMLFTANENYELYIYNSTSYVIDKKTGDHYLYQYNVDTLIKIDENTKMKSFESYLNSMDKQSYVKIKNDYIYSKLILSNDLKTITLLSNEFYIEGNIKILDKSDEYYDWAVELLSNIEASLSDMQVIEDEIDNIYAYSDFEGYHDINSMDTLKIDIYYLSGNYTTMLASELHNSNFTFTLPSTINDSLIINGITMDVEFFDLTLGSVLIVKENDNSRLLNLGDLSDFPQLNGELMYSNNRIRVRNDEYVSIIDSVEKLNELGKNNQVYFGEYVLYSLEEIINESKNIPIDIRVGDSNYNLKTNQFYQTYNSTTIEFTDNQLLVFRKDYSAIIPLENLNKNSDIILNIIDYENLKMVNDLFNNKLVFDYLNKDLNVYYFIFEGERIELTIRGDYIHIQDVGTTYIKESLRDKYEIPEFENKLTLNYSYLDNIETIIYGSNYQQLIELYLYLNTIIDRVEDLGGNEIDFSKVYISGTRELNLYLRNMKTPTEAISDMLNHNFITFTGYDYEYSIIKNNQIIIKRFNELIGIIDISYKENYITYFIDDGQWYKIKDLHYFPNIYYILDKTTDEDFVIIDQAYQGKDLNVTFNEEFIIYMYFGLRGFSFDDANYEVIDEIELNKSEIEFAKISVELEDEKEIFKNLNEISIKININDKEHYSRLISFENYNLVIDETSATLEFKIYDELRTLNIQYVDSEIHTYLYFYGLRSANNYLGLIDAFPIIKPEYEDEIYVDFVGWTYERDIIFRTLDEIQEYFKDKKGIYYLDSYYESKYKTLDDLKEVFESSDYIFNYFDRNHKLTKVYVDDIFIYLETNELNIKYNKKQETYEIYYLGKMIDVKDINYDNNIINIHLLILEILSSDSSEIKLSNFSTTIRSDNNQLIGITTYSNEFRVNLSSVTEYIYIEKGISNFKFTPIIDRKVNISMEDNSGIIIYFNNDSINYEYQIFNTLNFLGIDFEFVKNINNQIVIDSYGTIENEISFLTSNEINLFVNGKSTAINDNVVKHTLILEQKYNLYDYNKLHELNVLLEFESGRIIQVPVTDLYAFNIYHQLPTHENDGLRIGNDYYDLRFYDLTKGSYMLYFQNGEYQYYSIIEHMSEFPWPPEEFGINKDELVLENNGEIIRVKNIEELQELAYTNKLYEAYYNKMSFEMLLENNYLMDKQIGFESDNMMYIPKTNQFYDDYYFYEIQGDYLVRINPNNSLLKIPMIDSILNNDTLRLSKDTIDKMIFVDSLFNNKINIQINNENGLEYAIFNDEYIYITYDNDVIIFGVYGSCYFVTSYHEYIELPNLPNVLTSIYHYKNESYTTVQGSYNEYFDIFKPEHLKVDKILDDEGVEISYNFRVYSLGIETVDIFLDEPIHSRIVLEDILSHEYVTFSNSHTEYSIIKNKQIIIKDLNFVKAVIDISDSNHYITYIKDGQNWTKLTDVELYPNVYKILNEYDHNFIKYDQGRYFYPLNELVISEGMIHNLNSGLNSIYFEKVDYVEIEMISIDSTNIEFADIEFSVDDRIYTIDESIQIKIIINNIEYVRTIDYLTNVNVIESEIDNISTVTIKYNGKVKTINVNIFNRKKDVFIHFREYNEFDNYLNKLNELPNISPENNDFINVIGWIYNGELLNDFTHLKDLIKGRTGEFYLEPMFTSKLTMPSEFLELFEHGRYSFNINGRYSFLFDEEHTYFNNYFFTKKINMSTGNTQTIIDKIMYDFDLYYDEGIDFTVYNNVLDILSNTENRFSFYTSMADIYDQYYNRIMRIVVDKTQITFELTNTGEYLIIYKDKFEHGFDVERNYEIRIIKNDYSTILKLESGDQFDISRLYGNEHVIHRPFDTLETKDGKVIANNNGGIFIPELAFDENNILEIYVK